MVVKSDNSASQTNPPVSPSDRGPLVRAARRTYQKPNLTKKPRFRPASPPPPSISGVSDG